ncbi:hypothetical protein BH20ACT23_BH20ACT23_15930 [soil metagenome]
MPIVEQYRPAKRDGMDIKRLTHGELSAASAATLLIIASVIPLWGSVNLGDGQGGFDGESEIDSGNSFSLWEEGVFGLLPRLAVLIGLATLVLILVRAAGATRTIPSFIYLALGVSATLLMLMALAVGPAVQGNAILPFDIEVTRGPLLYAGAVLCAVITFGGWLHLRREDTDDFGNRSAAPPPM